jgi:hypothetical protein
MRWEDERYVRVYTRDTGEWLALGWEAQALFMLLLRKADRAGLVPTGKAGIRGLAALAGMPLDVVQRVALLLLEDGCLREATGGYVIPNFIVAQEARASDAQRKRDQRERDRDKAIASGSSGSRSGMDSEASVVRAQSQNGVTQGGHAMESHAVTGGHAGEVTPSLTVPSRTVPDTASHGSADAGQPPGERAVLTLTTQDAKPKPAEKKPRRLSAAEDLYLQVQAVREQRCEKAGVPYVPDRWPEARQNKDLGPVAKVPPGAAVDADGRTEEFQRFNRAFAEYLGDEKHAPKGWPLSLFMSGGVRSRYEQQALMGVAS